MVAENEHPYCSKRFTWPLMMRPVGYYFDSTMIDQGGISASYFTTIHLLPNPFIYWFSTIAITVMIVGQTINIVLKKIGGQKKQILSAVVGFGYLANLLPWAFIDRCLFLYHYQPASIFGFIALAWYLTELLNSNKSAYRLLAISLMVVIVLSFLYWLPFHMGFSIPEYEFSRRMWFESWI